MDGLPLSSYSALEVTDLADVGVREIVLCRPKLLNRFDATLHAEFTHCLRETALDPAVRAIVLASTGKAFSAGGDFEFMRAANEDALVRRSIIDDGRALLRALLDLEIPIVAAVQGAAIGLGATVALACDAVVAARTVSLADTHVNVGLVAGDGGCLLWPAAAGMLRARRHLLSGDPLTADIAFQLGMVTDLVDTPGEVRPAALALAQRIARNAPLAVRLTKRALNEVSRARADEVVDLAFGFEEQSLASQDLLEGIAAFRERRPPAFTGK